METLKKETKPRTVELVTHSYQPTKAELEEEISLDIPVTLSKPEWKPLLKP